MGKYSRDKGARFERLVRRWMNALRLESADWRRELRETQQGLIGDVYDQSRVCPIVIQTKDMKKPSPMSAFREALQGAENRGMPREYGVAIVKQTGGETVVMMTPRLFGELLVEAHNFGEWPDVIAEDIPELKAGEV